MKVCSIEFDRKDIKMNKMVIAGLEAKFHVYDLRTQHPTEGFTGMSQKVMENSTVWCVRHLPQNRDIFMTSGGSGALDLYF
jgi:WD repeat-containing protein 92